jgi:glutamate carboxypeptidase
MEGLASFERECVEQAAAMPMLGQVEAWAAINSGSRNLDGLKQIAAELCTAFSVLPGELELVDPDPVEAIDSRGKRVAVPHGQNIHLRVRPNAPLQLLFTGHMDTVFGADHAFQTTRLLEPGVLGGPGVADMKGGIAVMLAALKAIETVPLGRQVGYEVVLNSDEEVGSLASAELIASAAQGKRAALTYEPSALPDGTFAGARPGSGNFSFIVGGKSAHAGRNPHDGRNAVVAAADLALRLKEGVRDGLSINPARIDGGSPNNVVPDSAVLRVNLRPRTLADQLAAQKLIDSSVAVVAARHDLHVHVHGHFARPPKPMTPAMEALFGVVKKAGSDLGQTIAWQSTGGVCDGNNIAACGVPVIDTMGARGGSIHSMEEFLIVDSLSERAALSALTILRLAGGAA